MVELGLPHRIDHRRLDAQRDDALQRRDEEQAINLDRLPQIHMGKALHASHPGFTVFKERREANRAILAENTRRIERHENEHAVAYEGQQHAALNESMTIIKAQQNSLPPMWSEADLQKHYGRPSTRRHKLIQADIGAEAARILAKRQWYPSQIYDNGDSIAAFLRGEVCHRGAGHPIFTVTTRDLAFIFYRLGVTTLPALNRQLEDIRVEELKRFPRKAKTLRKPPARPVPPEPLRPEQARLTQLAQRAGYIQREMTRRHTQEQAFEVRMRQQALRPNMAQARAASAHTMLGKPAPAWGRSLGRLHHRATHPPFPQTPAPQNTAAGPPAWRP